jgi:uncharacterized protein (DUF362 family)
MMRVGLARCRAGYAGLAAPWAPSEAYPELASLFGDRAVIGTTNEVYAGVRASLYGLGLDAARFGTVDWNPIGALVAPGKHIVLKPNLIRHWNPASDGRGGSIDSVITHGAILRAVADYAFLAAGPTGRVTVAEAPQMDCDFEQIRSITGLDEIVSFYREVVGRELAVIDLRREAVVFRDGIVVERKALPGDPLGYRAVDLGDASFFSRSGLDPARFRGADYDSGPTTTQHSGGRNAYLLSETVLSADLVINLPKLKTHKKTGVTLAIKNLVGINGDKNWLPHHSVGSADEGGDEFPGARLRDRLRSRATEIARPLLARGLLRGLFRIVRRVESTTRGDDFLRSGNWYGNRTTWRMCCDINRCLYYSDRNGLHLDAPEPVRIVLTIVDGVVAGECEGPLAPVDVPLGVVLAGTDPIAVDLVAVRLIGFDERKLETLRGPMEDVGPRITAVRSASDVRVGEIERGGSRVEDRSLDEIAWTRAFVPHPGWAGHVERIPR